MQKALLKKQFLEMSASIRLGSEKGTVRKAGTLFLFALLLLYVLVLILGIFGFLAKRIAEPLHREELDWLYFAVMGLGALSVSVFCTAFSATGLFDVKDNEFLLSLPISTRQILFTRLFCLYLMILFFIGIIFFPATLVYLGASHRYAVFLSCAVSVLLLGLPALAIDAFVGWALLRISVRMKRKGLLSAFFVFAFLALYMALYQSMASYAPRFLADCEAISAALRRYCYPLYLFGKGCVGSSDSLLAFALFVAALMAIVCRLMKHELRRAPAFSGQQSRARPGRIDDFPVRGYRTALLKKEWRHFISDSDYMLNCGLGLLIMIVMGGYFIFQPNLAASLFRSVNSLLPQIGGLNLMLLGSMSVVCLSVGNTAAASISLEGDAIWIAKTIPLPVKDILFAKADFQFCLWVLPTAFFAAVCGISMDFTALECLCIAGYVLLAARLLSYADVMWNLLFPNLFWTSEMVPLKQSLSVFLALFSGIIAPLLSLVLYIEVCWFWGEACAAFCAAAFFAVGCLLCRRWLRTEGIRRWEAL